MIILDTNVLSALMKPSPDSEVISWMDEQPRTSVWTTSVTILEIRFGLQVMPLGKRRANLILAFDAVLSDKIEGRIAPFDAVAARLAGDLMAVRHKQGRPGDLRDTLIAGIALSRKAALATRNISHFEDLPLRVINPWASD
jgi:hypothetical protein